MEMNVINMMNLGSNDDAVIGSDEEMDEPGGGHKTAAGSVIRQDEFEVEPFGKMDTDGFIELMKNER